MNPPHLPMTAVQIAAALAQPNPDRAAIDRAAERLRAELGFIVAEAERAVADAVAYGIGIIDPQQSFTKGDLRPDWRLFLGDYAAAHGWTVAETLHALLGLPPGALPVFDSFALLVLGIAR